MNSFDCLDDLFEPVLVAKTDGEIVYFNSSFLTLFKTTPRSVKKSKNIEEYLSAMIPDFSLFYSHLKRDNQSISPELNFIIETQPCTIIIKGTIKETGHVFLSFKDMSVEKVLNDKYRAQVEELKSTHGQIIQSDKLKVIGEMTANISHEINNPLTVAVGNAELIAFALESADLNKERISIEKFNKNIAHSLGRISQIITNMKEFLHKSEDKKEYSEAREIVDKAISFLRPSLKGTSIDLKITMEGKSPILLVNRVKIEQVFVNLLQNAIDSLKESDAPMPSIFIDLSTDPSGNFVVIDVKDNGLGITEENRSLIFNTFFTTKEIGKGTGLGLSISNRIIQSHQGKLELLDSKDGAHFKITLPAIGIAGHMTGNWENLIADGGNFLKILFVDNEINILNLCMNFLNESGYHFLGASSAEEAFKELERANVDMIVTDVKMPNVDGVAFIKNLRAKNVNVPVVFMTSKDFVDKYKEVKNELDLKGIILKPFTKEELISAIGAIVK